jgi:CPA2 family monovalent cation:H+ antiporter-2
VVFWAVAFLPGKVLATLVVAAIMRWPAQAGIRVAVVLAHGGEFGLLLLTQAMAGGIIEPRLGQPVLVGLVLTMALAPVVIQRNASISRHIGNMLWRFAPVGREHALAEESQRLHDHVVICGCGRVGRVIGVALEAAKVSYIAIESDLTRLHEARQQGRKVVFGDASRRRVLEAAGLPRARLLVATFDSRPAVERLLHHARQCNPALPSIVSAADDREMSELATARASVVFPENLAAGLTLAHQVLLFSGFTQDDASRVITTVRAELNPELRGHVGV